MSCIVVIRQLDFASYIVYTAVGVSPATEGSGLLTGNRVGRGLEGVTSAAALLKPNPQPKFTSAKVTS